jgi:FMN-dependent oxidoreductase (nitrilotriacetate monooxygenase family)
MRNDTMHLGLFLRGCGHHVSAWRHPSSRPDAPADFNHYVAAARQAEDAKFDVVFLAESLQLETTDMAAASKMSPIGTGGHFEPLSLISALAARTEKIGLVATASTTFYQPYTLARAFGSIDLISQGRAGWNVITSTSELEAQNFGVQYMNHSDRYERATEFCEVVKKLWTNWAPDAFPRDVASGSYFDPSKLTIPNHKGQFFQVRGPTVTVPSPQGMPLVFVAGASEQGIELAAQHADAVFSAEQDLVRAQLFYRTISERAKKFGRTGDMIKVMPGVMPIIGDTEAEAKDFFEELQELVSPEVGRQILRQVIGTDLADYAENAIVPDLEEIQGQKSRQKLLLSVAHERNLTVRDLYLEVSGARGHHIVIGTPSQIADKLAEWFRTYACDGFNIMPPTIPGGLRRFTEKVVPELQGRRLFRTEYSSSTLRGHFGRN